MIKQDIHTVFRSIWIWWIITTIIYLILTFSVLGFTSPTPLGYLTGFIGLFVPYGFMSFILLIMFPSSWLSFAFFIFAMIVFEKGMKYHNLSLPKKILANLLALLVITFIVDLIRMTPGESWNIFINGYFPSDYLSNSNSYSY